MLAASAHVSTAKPAVPGDATAAPQSSASPDGFNGALAALMSQLGPQAPAAAAPTPAAPPASSGESSPRGLDGPSKSFAPADASQTAGPSLPGASDAPSEASGGAPTAAGSSQGAAASQAGAGAQPNAAAAAASGGSSQTATSQDGTVTQPVGSASTSPTNQTPLDPRLAQFVAQASSTAAAPTAASATDAGDPIQAGATATPADGAASGAIANDGAATDSQNTTTAAADGTLPAATSASLLTLIAPGQLGGTAAPAIQAAAAPTKSAKAVQIQTAVSASTTKAAPTSTSSIAAPTIASPGPSPGDAEADGPTFTLPHDTQAAASDGSQATQPPPDNSGNVAQIAPTTMTPTTATAATITAATSAAMASAHGADITAQLAAQITSRAGAARTAFDFALEPQGLGRVDVSLKIDPQGQLSATLSFDNPNAAAEARGRAGDLQQALQQAGFNVGQSGLSFTSGGNGQGAAGQSQGQSDYATTPVLTDAAADTIIASTSALGASHAGGLDITI
jgi:hypothetical protein